MEGMNFLPIIVAAFIPSIIGFIYYHPKVVGTAWMDSLGKTEAELRDGFNMPVAMVAGLIGAFLMAFLINVLLETGHKDLNEAGELVFASFHTFKHGAFHGLFYALLFAAPILVSGGLFERKSWKNILINIGYWVITLSLMGGLLDAWN